MDQRKKVGMLKEFDAFADRIGDRYKEARQALEDGNFVRAQEILARLAQSHAKTSLNLRNFLVRNGELEDS